MCAREGEERSVGNGNQPAARGRPLKSQGDGIRGIPRASEHTIRRARVPPLGLFRLVIVRSVEMNYTCDPIKAPSAASAGAVRAQQVSTHAEGVIHLAEGNG